MKPTQIIATIQLKFRRFSLKFNQDNFIAPTFIPSKKNNIVYKNINDNIHKRQTNINKYRVSAHVIYN